VGSRRSRDRVQIRSATDHLGLGLLALRSKTINEP
jgi:hypothetical protein